MHRSPDIKAIAAILIACALWSTALGQSDPNHTCDGTCEHATEGILATHQIANPAAITALFEAEEGDSFDVAVFAEALLVPLPASSPELAEAQKNGAKQKWKTRWEDGKWKGKIKEKSRKIKKTKKSDEEGGEIVEKTFLTLAAELKGGGELFLVSNGEGWAGRLAFRDSTDAWTFQGDETGGTIDTRTLPFVLCSVDAEGLPAAGLPSISTEGPEDDAELPTTDALRAGQAAPILNSYPGALGVLYLDFDGETVSGSNFNAFYTDGTDIVAKGSGFTNAEMQLIWRTVSEDYLPFNLNVTTDRAVFDAAPINRRTMVIFTPTNEWYGAAGGVAFTNIFSSPYYDEPAWVFVDQLLHNDTPHAPYAAEAASHEAGHTFGLNHHGDSSSDYYAGHGSGATSWAPIMGAAYQATVSHWSRGEYPDANNAQDDLAIIAGSTNGLGFRPDDVSLFVQLESGSPFPGIIGHYGDVDLFMLKTAGGLIQFSGQNDAYDPNLDIELRLLDQNGAVVAVASPEGNLDAFLEAEVPEGIYQVEITGGGNGDLVTGYSDYGSLGAYNLVANTPQGNPPVAVEILSPTVSSIGLPAGTGLVLEGTVALGTPDWAVISTPKGGSALLSDPTATSTRCEFTGAGSYEIRLQAVDVERSEIAILTVIVEDGESGWDGLTGTAVDLGADSEVFGDQAGLNPSIIEYAPFAPLSFDWTILSGDAVFSDPTAENPDLTFLAPGPVHLRLVVDTGSIATYDEVVLDGRFLSNDLLGGSTMRAFVPTGSSVDEFWHEKDFDDSAWQSTEVGVGYDVAGFAGEFSPLISAGLDVTAEMHGKSSSCYLRAPFTIDAPDAIIALDLNMQYDDGFVAYINGTEVARANVGSNATSGPNGLAVWSPGAAPKFNAWDGTSFGPNENGPGDSSGSGSGRWRIMQGASSPTRDEAIVIGIEDGGETSGMLWNGSSWSNVDMTSLADVDQTYWWNCAVAYEHQSGDAMIVYGDDNSAPYLSYKIWNGTSWSAPQTVPTWVGGPVRHLRLAANPNTDEMLLVVNSRNERDYALVWNGSSWSAPGQMDASTAQDRTDIYVAYESLSGHAVIVYETNTDSNLNYRVWNGSSWSGQGTIYAPAGASGYGRWSVMASDPSSNRIVLGVQSGTGPDGWVSIWDGSRWGSSTLLTESSLALDQSIAPNLGVAFESETGEALAVYGRANQNVFFYRTWTGDTWSDEQIGTDFGRNTNSMILEADPFSDRIMLGLQDDSSTLHFVQWDGTSWGPDNELESNSSETKNQPFIFLWSLSSSSPPSGGNEGGIVITEDFSSGNYSGGSGWTGDWSELSDDGNSGSGDVAITGGRLRLQLTGSGAIRSADLSSQTNATLSFLMQTFENGNDIWKVEANDGNGWVTLEQIEPIGGPGSSDVVERNETKTYQLEDFIALTSNVQIRFLIVQGYGQIGIQYVTLDDIRIESTGGGGSASGQPDWNSTAGFDRPDIAALNAETFRLTIPAGLLVEGQNILAVHGLNSSGTVADERFLLVPELTVTLADWPVFTFLSAINNPVSRGFGDDPDGDQMTNLIEYATGNDPESDEVGLLEVHPGAQKDMVEIRLCLPAIPPPDVRFEMQFRAHLHDPWTVVASKDAAGAWSGLQSAPPAAIGTTHEIHAFQQPEFHPGAFYRLKVRLIQP